MRPRPNGTPNSKAQVIAVIVAVLMFLLNVPGGHLTGAVKLVSLSTNSIMLMLASMEAEAVLTWPVDKA